jgi:hypothetical protein
MFVVEAVPCHFWRARTDPQSTSIKFPSALLHGPLTAAARPWPFLSHRRSSPRCSPRSARPRPAATQLLAAFSKLATPKPPAPPGATGLTRTLPRTETKLAEGARPLRNSRHRRAGFEWQLALWNPECEAVLGLAFGVRTAAKSGIGNNHADVD